MKNLLYAAGSILTGFVLKIILEKIWEKIQGTPAPKDPSDYTTPVKDAFVWTLAISVITGMGKLAYRRFVPSPDKKLTA